MQLKPVLLTPQAFKEGQIVIQYPPLSVPLWELIHKLKELHNDCELLEPMPNLNLPGAPLEPLIAFLCPKHKLVFAYIQIQIANVKEIRAIVYFVDEKGRATINEDWENSIKTLINYALKLWETAQNFFLKRGIKITKFGLLSKLEPLEKNIELSLKFPDFKTALEQRFILWREKDNLEVHSFILSPVKSKEGLDYEYLLDSSLVPKTKTNFNEKELTLFAENHLKTFKESLKEGSNV